MNPISLDDVSSNVPPPTEEETVNEKLDEFEIMYRTIFFHIFRNHITLSKNDIYVLSIFTSPDIDDYSPAHGINNPTYQIMYDLYCAVDYDNQMFEVCEDNHGPHIAINFLSDIIQYVLPDYPFSFASIDDIDDSLLTNMKKYITLTDFDKQLYPNKHDVEKAYQNFMKSLREYAPIHLDTTINEIRDSAEKIANLYHLHPELIVEIVKHVFSVC